MLAGHHSTTRFLVDTTGLCCYSRGDLRPQQRVLSLPLQVRCARNEARSKQVPVPVSANESSTLPVFCSAAPLNSRGAYPRGSAPAQKGKDKPDEGRLSLLQGDPNL